MDRNQTLSGCCAVQAQSLSARRAWIEINTPVDIGSDGGVALRKESVDRNQQAADITQKVHNVALRKESVDRNQQNVGQNYIAGVALRKESVDRNHLINLPRYLFWKSLSARRAWIEMTVGNPHMLNCPVALRKESVDRNMLMRRTQTAIDLVALRKESVDRNASAPPLPPDGMPSLSARRAWIEMAHLLFKQYRFIVALRKESVDRN